MAENRAGHNGKSKASTQPSRPRNQDQNRRDQFGDAGADPAPRLKSDFREDVNRFGCGGEFKEQCLQQNYRSRNTANPGDDSVRFS